MNQLEQILIFGRLGKNPELKYTAKQEAVCNFTVAEKSNDRELPRWHRIVVWGTQAELCNLYLKKGSSVFVQGQIRQREFKNEEGVMKKYTEISASQLGYIFEKNI